MSNGRLIVFEGPDGVGKTTLANALNEDLNKEGVRCRYMSFPGRELGTLGRLVYDVHHEPERFGVSDIDPTSLQMLHVAAHVDAIERTIKPLLRQGDHVVLDRFWWSTLAYGVVGGSNQESLERMVSVEELHWGSLLPSAVLLIERESPTGDVVRHSQLSAKYRSLAARNESAYPVHRIPNDRTIRETSATIRAIVQLLFNKS